MESPTSTFTLLEKAKAGDEDALSTAFEKYQRRLAVLVHFKLSPHERDFSEVEDVVQETCLRAFRDIQRFSYQSPGSFLRWLSSIADHVIVDRVRYRKRGRRAGEHVPFRSPSNPLGPEPADTRTPSRLFAQQETVERLLAQLSALPEDYREAILMAKIEGLSTAEIAERLGKFPRSGGPSRLSRGEAPPRDPGSRGSLMDEAQEQRLADALAEVLDRRTGRDTTQTLFPELAAELATLDELDRVLELDGNTAAAAALPERLSGHRILEEIGSGGMGRVLLAVDEALGRKVAIKTLAARYAGDPVLRARFMGEARAMAKLSHPNIARIYNLGPPDEPPHFVMEYVDGAHLTRAAAHLTFEQRAELMRKVALATQFLHEQGIIHRDLKPANILVGPDLEPKLLDFGLALALDGQERLSRLGEVAGTPEYFSPEQAGGAANLDARSDIFSLGAIFYELLTGAAPFRADGVQELLRCIREEEPVLPRRADRAVPRDLQNICLKALEKSAGDRYASAREMADDLRRFLADEAVLAQPGAYARLISGKVEQHLRDLESWRHDLIVSDAEYDGIRKRYERLLEREDAWILEARRLTLPQVSLYLGAWILVVGVAFLTFFRYPALAGAPAVLLAWAAAAPTAWVGIRNWRRGHYRVAIAYLLAFCLIVPVAGLVTVEETHLFTGLTQGQPRLELFHRLGFAKEATNAQLWWSLLAGLPVCWWLRRFTRAPVFSLMFAAMSAMLCLVTLLRMGVLDCLDKDPGRFYFDLIPCALLFMAAGFVFERVRLPDDSRYFYPFAVAFTLAALSGVATFHEPYANWLQSAAPWTRGQIEYLFLINAAIYLVFDRLCDRFPSAQVRMVGKSFRFVIPGHVMTSLLLLGLGAESHFEQRLFEWLLPAVACTFVFASIPRQMKNFFISGLVFFAIGAYRLQQEVFQSRAFWPAFLLLAGLGLMLAAANYAPLRIALARVLNARRPR